ncbi:unnamed protein product [Aphanomyces euteiches]
MNARGCAQTPVLTPKVNTRLEVSFTTHSQLFCAAYTDDLRQVMAMLRAKVVPTASLVSVGFSLGSNIMVKYIGEEGERCPLTAAVSVGNPYDIVECTRNLTHSLLPRLLYSGEMTKGLVSLFFERSNAHEKFATHPAIDLAKIRQVRTPSEFDEYVTRQIFGFAPQSQRNLKRVRIPLLCLTADDDPICVDRSTPHDDVKASDYIILATTTTGGHLGFYSGNNPFETPDQWSSNAIVHFCRAVDLPLDEADEDELDASEVPTTKSDLQDEEISVLHVAGAIFAVACVVQATSHSDDIIATPLGMERKAMEVWRQVVEMAEKDRMVQKHLHTIFLSMLESHPKINYQRQMVPLSDGGVVSLDWAIPPGVDPSTEINCLDVPTVVIFHGLTGGSGDNYVCVAVEKLLRHGWRVVVMNARGCAKTPVLTAKLFCGAYTNDVREVVACLRKNHVPTAPLISVGFSLGSNIMVKYIGEEGEKCQLTAAVSVGNPYDFLCNSRNMNFSFVHNLIYNGPLATNLKNLFFVRSNAHEHFSNHPEIDLEAIKASVRVSDFDEHLTRRAFG